MKRLNFLRWVAVMLAMPMASAIPSAVRADAVTDWNAIMQATVTAPPTTPFYQARWGAIVQLAVFEAVNAVTGDYEPYLGTIAAPPWASPDAAAIAAAYRTLVTLRPSSAAAWNEAVAALEKSAGLRNGGDSFDWFFLAMAHWKLGAKDKAREWYDKAVRWMDTNQPKNEELHRFRAEAAELLRPNENK